MSEQPILNNQIKYRNGIPVGKPIRQHDNDSSFASEYPDVWFMGIWWIDLLIIWAYFIYENFLVTKYFLF